MLFDLGNCEVLLDALGSVLLPSESPVIIPYELLRCCPWNSGFGARSVADETVVTSPSCPLTSRLPFDITTSFRDIPVAALISLGGGEGRVFFNLLLTGVSVDDGSLTKGVPSARVIRRGSGQDCWGVTGW